MIEKITLTNFLSFKNETEFDFSASQEKQKKGFEYMDWVEEVNGKKILKTQFLFGNNGTGKSNYISAIDTLRNLVCKNSKSKSNDLFKISNCAFKLSEETKNKPSKIKIVFNAEDIRYHYEIEWTDSVIISECLEKSRGKGKKFCLFTRSFDAERDITVVSFPSNEIKPETQNTIIENTIKNSSVISLYDVMNIEAQDLRNVYNYFRSINIIYNMGAYDLIRILESRQDEDKLKPLLLSLLKDLGSNIIDYQIDTVDVKMDENEARFLHSLLGEELFNKECSSGYKKIKSIRYAHPTDIDDKAGWLQKESLGTLNMIKLIVALYDSCMAQVPVFIDECAYGIHQMTFGRIIQFFLSISHRTQAIMASQNLSIMEMEGFRRDTIKIFDKNRKTGETFCNKIDLRKYHKNLNIVRTYLNDSFGGLPKFPPIDEWAKSLKRYRKTIEESQTNE